MTEPDAKEKARITLYTEFHKHDQKGDHDRALKVINKVLQMCPDDTTAFQCKIVCLIYLNRFEEALSHINKNPKHSADMHFEKAYSLYRTNQPENALTVINSAPQNHRCQELRAQILYRLERYQESFNAYDEIIRSDPNDDYEEERQTNLSAVVSSLNDAKMLKSVENQLQEDTYEMCYNKALMYAQAENFQEAEKLLKKAEKLLRESFEEDGASEEETEAELAHIRVLQGYCWQKQGRTKEAHSLYLSALKQKIDDISLSAVASNNVVVINKDQNVFDSKKKMKVATNDQLVHKLPSEQRKNIALNNAIFNYYSNHHDQVTSLSNTVEKTWPELKVQCRLLKALNLYKAPTKQDPIQLLLKAAQEASNEAENFILKMTCVQLLLQNGDKKKACEVLEDIGDYRYKPGIVGALITLYLNQGKEDVALKVYEEAIEWYKKNERSGLNLTSLFKQAADFHIRNGRPQVAAKSLEQLLAKEKNDTKTISQLIIAYSQFDEKKAIELRKRLANVVDLDVDLDTLESNVWLTAKKSATTSKVDISPGPIEKKKRKHRKRKGKLPKNYDANSAPDPERWLPRYERSGYRKKRDRRMKDVIKGSQGTASGHSDQYDFSGKTVDDDSAPSVEPSPMQKSGPRQNMKKGGGNKKKNKRR
ncbi:signal recognition particle subunit SRP72 [Atheta coriaria]|uniref:signal recognition particle subunit SRP72 n=1 Tax=Dalotia coriaria TaxID=877792 RepID=UPI0031F470A7